MKSGSHKYYYNKILNGIRRYGGVEIVIKKIDTNSRIVDNCSWNSLKKVYSDFKELDILKIWKKSATDTAKSVIETYKLPFPVEIEIVDIEGLYVDTTPATIGAAILIAIFDYIESPLRPSDIESVDQFVIDNSGLEVIPEFNKILIDKMRI